MKRNILYTLLCLCALVWGLAGCQDDWLAGTDGTGIGTIHATVDFRPMDTGLVGKSRAAGDAIKSITNLYVLLYDYDTGSLVRSEEITAGKYELKDVERSDADAENGHTAESRTKQASFSLKDIPYGKYRMYVVANMPDFLSNHKDDIQTVDGLKSVRLVWNNDTAKVADNGEMLGYFTANTANQPEDDPLVINSKNMNLHAWLRRAASKITIAYDGTALKEGVFVYLKSVQIKDIPAECYLGKANNVGGEGYTLNCPTGTDKEISAKMLDGQKIKYYQGEEEPTEFNSSYSGPRLTAGNPKYGSHDEKAPALYFYENMQGEGKDKRQDGNKDGVLDAPGLPDDTTYVLKDDKPYGTYIEVVAHYESINSEKLGSGNIIYRFMLGQDVLKDYNAKRNCHYKLTLKFKNFANDVDWHIEYEEPDPGVVTVDPYYISYLYNHSMMYPVKINTGGRKIEYIKATIKDNRWAPHNANHEVYYYQMDKPGENQWNGFLSLHKTSKLVITGTKPFTALSNKAEYVDSIPAQGVRTYKDFSIGTHTTENSEDDDTYRVEKLEGEEHTYNVFLPMYTRAKQLIKETGYTGNNPYAAYQRKAVVEIETKLEGLDPVFKKEVTIFQVNRVVNPKGIYRSFGNNKSFHVVLKNLPQENAEKFEVFESEGPWKAYVVKETNGTGIKLREQQGMSSLSNDTIYGKTGSNIDFHIDFNQGTDNLADNRYAIIRVEYNNYTCYHLIFVRQGDKPDNLVEGGAEWYAENMRTKTQRAESPLDEGSLFKLGNWDYPIDALNNKNPKSIWTHVKPTDFKLYPADGFVIAGKPNEKKTWGEITFPSTITDGNSLFTFSDPTSDMKVASAQEYGELYKHQDIAEGYGVLYGDNAVEVGEHINDVYGYDYEHSGTGRGMRGCFVYNKETGKNLFFPIGASGYGHRKEKENGILRYAGQTAEFESSNVAVYPNGVNDVPLFYDVYKRPGAIYWAREWYKDTGSNSISPDPVVGWDFNYYTFDFFPITHFSTGGRKDACFVRCVRKK